MKHATTSNLNLQLPVAEAHTARAVEFILFGGVAELALGVFDRMTVDPIDKTDPCRKFSLYILGISAHVRALNANRYLSRVSQQHIVSNQVNMPE